MIVQEMSQIWDLEVQNCLDELNSQNFQNLYDRNFPAAYSILDSKIQRLSSLSFQTITEGMEFESFRNSVQNIIEFFRQQLVQSQKPQPQEIQIHSFHQENINLDNDTSSSGFKSHLPSVKKDSNVNQSFQERDARKRMIQTCSTNNSSPKIVEEDKENRDIERSSAKTFGNLLYDQNINSFSSQPFKDQTKKLNRGLKNLGQTCYINSLLQCLFHIKPFRESLLAYYENVPFSHIFVKLRAFFKEMEQDDSREAVDFAHEELIEEIFKARKEFKLNKQGDSGILFQAIIEELSLEKEAREIPYLKVFVGGDLVKTRECLCPCRQEKKTRESIKRLEVRDRDFTEKNIENYFQPPTEFRKCGRQFTQTAFRCNYYATNLPEILVVRIHDTENNGERVSVMENIILEEKSSGPQKDSRFVHYRFISGVFNSDKGVNGAHSVEISKHDGEYYEFNDFYVSKVRSLNFFYKHPRLLVYKRDSMS